MEPRAGSRRALQAGDDLRLVLLAPGRQRVEDGAQGLAQGAEPVFHLSSPQHAALLEDTPRLADLRPADFDAVFVCGGQSPMVTFVDDQALHRFVADAYEAGKVVAVICHGTCILLKARLTDGSLLVAGKTWTGFANAEEDYADAFVGRRIQPFRIQDEAEALAGTNFIVNGAFKPFALRDGRLITGQQQYSGAAAAQLVIEALGV